MRLRRRYRWTARIPRSADRAGFITLRLRSSACRKFALAETAQAPLPVCIVSITRHRRESQRLRGLCNETVMEMPRGRQLRQILLPGHTPLAVGLARKGQTRRSLHRSAVEGAGCLGGSSVRFALPAGRRGRHSDSAPAESDTAKSALYCGGRGGMPGRQLRSTARRTAQICLVGH